MKLPVHLSNPKKGFINIKNNDQKCFLWCHIKHINPVKIHSERITRNDKELVNDLNYEEIEFPMSKNDFSKMEAKKEICINAFRYENKSTFPIYISDQKIENWTDLLFIINENKLHYTYIKDFNRFMFHKTKQNNNKKNFCKSCLHFFSRKMC